LVYENSDPIITSTGLLDYNPKTLISPIKCLMETLLVKIYFATQAYAGYNLKITSDQFLNITTNTRKDSSPICSGLENDISVG